VLPEAEIQLCIVHMIRNSIKLNPFKDRKGVAIGSKVPEIIGR